MPSSGPTMLTLQARRRSKADSRLHEHEDQEVPPDGVEVLVRLA